MTPENAEIMALKALGWLAGEEDGLQRLLDQSGLDADAMRAQAGTRELGTAILSFLLAQEDLLLQFCEAEDVAPKDVHLALHRLDGAVT